ncbi:muconate/chloromuconate family cycloisomerase (plasmid) [Limimaricola variabilis]|uniref:muconate/chloromuconate family cycloisomerase n=1 Tax=Limimaricola variabilis TaxID=1492771 RepID=UPI002AC8DBF2|nr:muconate/chloromuconate family cycloisomerase [Limimaricola variabilis]WPY96189.1 muconate/chloromuconate family cycloisomerase [Limimaricola variabilis]
MSKIDHIETTILDIPTIRGHVLSMTTMTVQSVVLVRIRFGDGSEGWGEGTAIGGMSYGPESPESIRLAIDAYIAPAITGMEGDDVNAVTHKVERLVRGNPIARCAVETALWDGLGRRLGVSVAQLFGGPVRETMPVAWTLASGNSETDIAEAREMIAARRHNIFKLKIGKRALRDDLAHVGAIKSALGDGASIRVDVNQAWNVTEARHGLRGLQEIGVDLVEQPIAARFHKALGHLTDAYEIAVMADEALQGPEDAMRVAAERSADVFAVKIAQSGGLRRAAEVVAIAQSAGIGIYGGTMLEAGIGTAAAVQLFSTVERLGWGTELFGPLLMKDEILTTPIEYRDFSLVRPQGPGLGVVPDPEKIARYDRDAGRVLRSVAGE